MKEITIRWGLASRRHDPLKLTKGYYNFLSFTFQYLFTKLIILIGRMFTSHYNDIILISFIIVMTYRVSQSCEKAP
jgi:hypothetical protein